MQKMEANLSNFSNVRNSTNQPGNTMEQLNIVTVVFCFIIIAVGVIGNILVLVVFAGGWVRARSCGVYLINMALANIIGTTIIPTELILELLQYGIRPIGAVGCRTLSFLSTASVSVSSFSLVLVSIDRYIVTRRPKRNAFSPLVMILIIAFIWILGGSVGVIYLIGNRVRLHNQGDIWVCRSFAMRAEMVVHTLITLNLQVVIPLLVMIVLYIAMATQIKSNSMRPLLYPTEQSKEKTRRDKRAMKILLLIVAVFFFCQIPVNVMYVLGLFDVIVLTTPVNFRIYTVLHMLQMASNCINPIIYFVFRRYLEAVTEGNESVLSNQNEAYAIE